MAIHAGLWEPLVRAPFFVDLESRLEKSETGVAVTGLLAGARALVVDRLVRRLRRPMFLVVADDAAVDTYQRDLATLARLDGRDAARVAVLPALDADPWDGIGPHPEVVRERVLTLGRLARGELDVLMVPARALLGVLPSRTDWRRWCRSVSVDETLPPDRFVLDSLQLGYRRVDTVSAPGEISRRGGIIDIFPPNAAEPVRIELFGDTVESLRSFDTDNQRSTGKLESLAIDPAAENPPTDSAVARLARHLESHLSQAEDDQRKLRAQLDMLQEHGHLPGFESLTRLTSEKPSTVFDYAEGMLCIVDEPELTDGELLRADADLRSAYEQSGNRALPPPAELFGDPVDVRRELASAACTLQELGGELPGSGDGTIEVVCRGARAYSGRMHEFIDQAAKTRAEGARIVCLTRAEGSAQRLGEILAESDLQATRWQPGAVAGAATGGLYVGVGSFRDGFELPEAGLVVYTEREIFGEKRKVADRKSKTRKAFISDFRDLKVGDTVVHIDHGVARYSGLGRPKGGSLNRDFMLLEFARGDRLFVPVDRLDLVQKYSGVAGQKPQLDKLGGPGWERVKSKVRKSVESMAKDLLDLYARRKAARGHAFSQDTAWQTEMEAAFPFELTPDQQRALVEIKRDMESPRPTDRLLVGDVGFGKTEVAVRAAFKAVMDGYQVAVLSPTTVLAAQHFETFRERFAAFPSRVEMLSRFRSPAEAKKTLRDLELGAVDVLIGTHRLLSKDVHFKRLGLLVVDEEQRFGVAHKERLKRMTVGVDVLSMTATPIPRTLQMSMAGVRDLSIIETAPAGRMAIQTYIVPFRKNVLAQAIRQELRRRGQVFVVHNRIETLPAMVRAVQEMAPEARVVMAHGQMGERQLESVMLKFVNHEADVLVTTTIIENGLDIPRANTIIVNRADRFGLAQLYQLRGRIGRSHEHAYAYLVVPSRQDLSGEARKRLKALQDFSDLGAGFRLAAADLEIRGAGELLGSRQHGHIAALGFDLYCQMLERAVGELQGEPVDERQPVSLHLGVDIKIPEGFLPESADRLVVYKRLAQAAGGEEVDRLEGEIEDRYGHLPQAARNLFEMGRLRLLAEHAGLKSIDWVEGKLQFRFNDKTRVDPANVLALIDAERGSLTPSGQVTLPAPPRGGDRIAAVLGILRRMVGKSVPPAATGPSGLASDTPAV